MPPHSVFLSYRRADSAGDVRYLYDLLSESLGEGQVFMDVDSISYGEDFVEVIERTLTGCQVVLVVMGPSWLSVRDERGRLRLERPSDPVRVEVMAALSMKVKLIPVLVGGAVMPDEEELPEGLKPLSRRNAFVLSHDKRFKRDVQDLVEVLRKLLVEPATVSVVQVVPPPVAPLVLQVGQIERETVNGVSFEMVAIPAGSFQMGSPDTEEGRWGDEGPVHTVNVKDFWMGKTEVTQGLWKAVMGSNPSDFNSCGENCPVENVSWNDAQEFIKKLNGLTGKQYRLPSESEWEYSARAGTKNRWSFGDQKSQLREYAWYTDNSSSKTHPVGQKKPNPWGLYDMHGNVREWVQDAWVDRYNGAPTDGSAREGDNDVVRVSRGGSWNGTPQFLRSANRFRFAPGNRDYSTGFRLARIN